jgi:hypothetical protein
LTETVSKTMDAAGDGGGAAAGALWAEADSAAKTTATAAKQRALLRIIGGTPPL